MISTKAASGPLGVEELRLLDAYWRAANCLSVGQIYLRANPLLREPLTLDHVKPRLLGHWGTTPGLNLLYAHMNRAIRKRHLSAIYVTGPGHGGPGLVANVYLEGTYSEVYPRIAESEEGLRRLFEQFSFPGGIPSHVAPETPGSIHEGGELGYSLVHAYGAVFDNPQLLALCVVGDREAETGPLAAGWHSNKFVNPARDGAVLPVLHLNGYKIANPTVLARIPADELSALLEGYGHSPRFVEGDDPDAVHQALAAALDSSLDEIARIRERARAGDRTRPAWPMIVLRTPKGWTGPKEVGDLRALRPRGEHGMGANPHANGGLLLRDLELPDYRSYAVKVERPGATESEATRVLGIWVRDVMRANDASRNLRLFGPDETASNRLGAAFEASDRAWMAERRDGDDHLSAVGRVKEVLGEHLCQGWLEGYLLTGRHGIFNCYEAFIHIVDSMFNQHAKWLKVTREIPWRRPIASPPDANCLLSVADHCLRSRDYVNVIVAGKQPALDYLSMDDAITHCTRGIGIWDWASNEDDAEPDVVLACAGDIPTLETLAATALLREHLPDLRVRVVNTVDLMRLQPDSEHPHGLPDAEFDAIFTTSRPVNFAYHGYPWLIHRLAYRRSNHPNLHVRGYKEEGTTTTPFDMVMLNDLDRFHLVMDVIDRVPGPGGRAAGLRQLMADERLRHRAYTREHGDDPPDVREWTWPG